MQRPTTPFGPRRAGGETRGQSNVLATNVFVEPEFCTRSSSPPRLWDAQEEPAPLPGLAHSAPGSSSLLPFTLSSSPAQSPSRKKTPLPKNTSGSGLGKVHTSQRKGRQEKFKNKSYTKEPFLSSTNDTHDPFRLVKSDLTTKARSASMRESRGVSMEEYLERRLLDDAFPNKHRTTKSLENFLSLHSDRAVALPPPSSPRRAKSSEEIRRGPVHTSPASPRRCSRRTKSADFQTKHDSDSPLPTPRDTPSTPTSSRGKSVEEEFYESFIAKTPLAAKATATPTPTRKSMVATTAPSEFSSPYHSSLKKTLSKQPHGEIPFLDDSWFVSDKEDDGNQYDPNEDCSPGDDRGRREAKMIPMSPCNSYKRALVSPTHRPRSSISRGRSLRVHHSSRSQRTAARSLTPNGRRDGESSTKAEAVALVPILAKLILDGESESEPEELLPPRPSKQHAEDAVHTVPVNAGQEDWSPRRPNPPGTRSADHKRSHRSRSRCRSRSRPSRSFERAGL